MKLITKEIERKAPALYATENMSKDEIPVIAKYFSCFSGWTWYMTEYDPESGLAFGAVKGFETELGFFSIAQFDSYNAQYAPLQPIERDMYYKPGSMTLADVLAR